MEQYIKKSALVAEIEKIREYANENWDVEEVKGIDKFIDKLESYINTLEVKEVNLGKEIEDYFKGWSEDKDNGAACHYQYVDLQDCKAIAKHFFELGLKAQKGE